LGDVVPLKLAFFEGNNAPEWQGQASVKINLFDTSYNPLLAEQTATWQANGEAYATLNTYTQAASDYLDEEAVKNTILEIKIEHNGEARTVVQQGFALYNSFMTLINVELTLPDAPSEIESSQGFAPAAPDQVASLKKPIEPRFLRALLQADYDAGIEPFPPNDVQAENLFNTRTPSDFIVGILPIEPDQLAFDVGAQGNPDQLDAQRSPEEPDQVQTNPEAPSLFNAEIINWQVSRYSPTLHIDADAEPVQALGWEENATGYNDLLLTDHAGSNEGYYVYDSTYSAWVLKRSNDLLADKDVNELSDIAWFAENPSNSSEWQYFSQPRTPSQQPDFGTWAATTTWTKAAGETEPLSYPNGTFAIGRFTPDDLETLTNQATTTSTVTAKENFNWLYRGRTGYSINGKNAIRFSNPDGYTVEPTPFLDTSLNYEVETITETDPTEWEAPAWSSIEYTRLMVKIDDSTYPNASGYYELTNFGANFSPIVNPRAFWVQKYDLNFQSKTDHEIGVSSADNTTNPITPPLLTLWQGKVNTGTKLREVATALQPSSFTKAQRLDYVIYNSSRIQSATWLEHTERGYDRFTGDADVENLEEMHIFAVLKPIVEPDSTASTRGFLYNLSGLGTNGRHLLHAPWSDGRIYADFGRNETNYRIYTDQLVNSTDPFMFTAYNSEQEGKKAINFNGSEEISVNTSTFTNIKGNFSLMASGNESQKTDLGEILLFRNVLSESRRQKIEGYLAHKWGLTANLPASHPYKALHPSNDQVGDAIGLGIYTREVDQLSAQIIP